MGVRDQGDIIDGTVIKQNEDEKAKETTMINRLSHSADLYLFQPSLYSVHVVLDRHVIVCRRRRSRRSGGGGRTMVTKKYTTISPSSSLARRGRHCGHWTAMTYIGRVNVEQLIGDRTPFHAPQSPVRTHTVWLMSLSASASPPSPLLIGYWRSMGLSRSFARKCGKLVCWSDHVLFRWMCEGCAQLTNLMTLGYVSF